MQQRCHIARQRIKVAAAPLHVLARSSRVSAPQAGEAAHFRSAASCALASSMQPASSNSCGRHGSPRKGQGFKYA